MNGGIAFKTSGDASFLLLRAISSPTNTHQPRCFGAGLTHVKLTQPYIPGISLKFKMTERSDVAKTLALATGEGGARSPRPLLFNSGSKGCIMKTNTCSRSVSVLLYGFRRQVLPRKAAFFIKLYRILLFVGFLFFFFPQLNPAESPRVPSNCFEKSPSDISRFQGSPY